MQAQAIRIKAYGTSDSSDEEFSYKKSKVEQKEGDRTMQKRHSGKLKQWIWNAAVTWKFAVAKFNLLLQLPWVVSITQRWGGNKLHVSISQQSSIEKSCMHVWISLFRVDQVNSTTRMTNKNWLTAQTEQKWRHDLVLYLSLLQIYVYRARFILDSGDHEVLRFIQLNI